MNGKAWIFTAAMLATGMAQAACYSVYKADGTLILETPTTPVNLSLPLGDTVPEKFGPGATMTVSDLGFYCKERRGAALKPATALHSEPPAGQPAEAKTAQKGDAREVASK